MTDEYDEVLKYVAVMLVEMPLDDIKRLIAHRPDVAWVDIVTTKEAENLEDRNRKVPDVQ